MIPFNAVNFDRMYNADDIAAMLSSVVTDGVHPSPGSSLAVRADGGWSISVMPGRCIIKGRVGVNNAARHLTLSPPDGTWPRIDAIVIRCDFDGRIIDERVKKGTSASDPATPTLTRDEHAWEIMLAKINISPSANAIAQTDITDTRWNGTVCGVMHSMIEVGAEGLFDQFESAWAIWFERIKRESEGWQDGALIQFQKWLAGVRNLLEVDAAASLASAVKELQDKVTSLSSNSTGMIYEKSRDSGTIYPADWSMNDSLGLWQAKIMNSSISYTDTDAQIIINPDSLKQPVLGSATIGMGHVMIYASRKPGNAVNYTLIATGKRG